MPEGKRFFNDLIDHWKALPRGEGRTPSRTAFNPMKLHKMLPYLYFGERVGKYQMQLRLVGDELGHAMRDLLPSRNVFDAFPKDRWEYMEAYYGHLRCCPCAGHAVRRLKHSSGLVYDIETLGLPLADKNGEPRYIFGLVEMKKNRAKSIAVQHGEIVLDETAELDYWDIGYGVPKHEGQAVPKSAHCC